MKKKLFTLLLCAFAAISANAAEVNSNGAWVIYGTGVDGHNPDDIGSLGNIPDDVTAIKLVGTFNGWSGGPFINGDNNKKNITVIDLEAATFAENTVTKHGTGNYSYTYSWKFVDFTGLTTILWPNDGSMKVIPNQAFQSSGIINLTLPSSILHVGKQAFVNNKRLAALVIPRTVSEDLVIVEEAFVQSEALRDVYIMCEKPITAEFHAFDFMTTNGQSQEDVLTCALHFPESQTKHFANLNHPLTWEVAESPGAFHDWLVEHRNQAKNAGQNTGNGWFEFISSGSLPPDNPTVSGDVILTTYSNYAYDHLTPAGCKAYVVSDVQQDGTYSNGKKKFKLTLTSVVVIPRQTGVILYGQANATTLDGQKTFTMTTVKYEDNPFNRKYWELDASGNFIQDANGQYVKNYLEPTDIPTTDASGKIITDADGVPVAKATPPSVKPFDMEDGVVKWRNFAMGKYSSTDTGKKNGVGLKDDKNYVGFFRLKAGEMPAEKAYLRLSATEYDEPEGGEVVVEPDPNYTKIYRGKPAVLEEEHVEGKDDYWTKAVWNGPVYSDKTTGKYGPNWGTRDTGTTFAKFTGEPIFEENEDGSATLIISADDIKGDENAPYFNLQGVKINLPAKSGIYVKNGKKVIIK